MKQIISPSELEAALSDTSGVYVNNGVDAATYYAELADHIRQNLCEPFAVSAIVMEPGFPDAEVGSVINGQCIAHDAGYWLVYQPEEGRFYCFWGQDPAHLGAHGVSGGPLHCWFA